MGPWNVINMYVCKPLPLSSSSYSITNLGQGGLFWSQHSRHLVVFSVVIQVVVFLLDDNLNFFEGACSLLLLLLLYMKRGKHIKSGLAHIRKKARKGISASCHLHTRRRENLKPHDSLVSVHEIHIGYVGDTDSPLMAMVECSVPDRLSCHVENCGWMYRLYIYVCS
jgi:hypothetical protein